jgi:N-acetylmuramate 1-kinase
MEPIVHTLESTEEMERLAAGLSTFARTGCAILLHGDLGAGKSVFARAFIQALAGEGTTIDVPSPTFTLIQTYEETRLPVAHIDLYRLSSSREAEELGLEELLKGHILLIEWPERIDTSGFENTLSVSISGQGHRRTVILDGAGDCSAALSRNQAIGNFLASTHWRNSRRFFLEGDASFRRYETLAGGNAPRAILMDMQARPDGPPVKDGKPYSAIAHLAEDIRSVIAVNGHLHRSGYSAPEIYAANPEEGLAVIEDLGNRVYGRMRLAGEDMRLPMQAAVEVLAGMAAKPWPKTVPVTAATLHTVPDYDRGAQLIEADLLPGWFWPYLHGIEVPRAIKDEFDRAWSSVLHVTEAGPPVWVLRDFHSPNLLWLPDREGVRRVGLIDTQDCLMGHPAYDLASLLQDARVDIPAGEEALLFNHYCDLRTRQAVFDRSAFSAAYAVLGAQRATKILGIFARLSKRDGKHGYLQHLPRVSRYLERNLQHAVLAPVREWYGRYLPQQARERQA